MPTLDSLSAGSTQTSPRVPSLPFRALLLPTRLTLVDLCLTSQQRSTSLPSKSFRPSSCSRTGRSSTRTSSCLSYSENTRPRSRVSCASFGVWLFVPFLLLSEMICSSDGSGGLTLEGSGRYRQHANATHELELHQHYSKALMEVAHQQGQQSLLESTQINTGLMKVGGLLRKALRTEMGESIEADGAQYVSSSALPPLSLLLRLAYDILQGTDHRWDY